MKTRFLDFVSVICQNGLNACNRSYAAHHPVLGPTGSGAWIPDLDNSIKAFQRAYAKDLILPTAQEFADFQEEMRMQRRLRNLEDENDPAESKQCSYFSGRRNNEAGYIEDTIIKDSEGCLKELPYTCVLYLPDKGSCRPIKRNSYESYDMSHMI